MSASVLERKEHVLISLDFLEPECLFLKKRVCLFIFRAEGRENGRETLM